MNRRHFHTAALALFAAASARPLLAQGFPPAPSLGTPKAFKAPPSETYTLPNGMTVTLIPSGTTPKAEVSLRVYAGNLNEGTQTWLPDLAGELMKEGAGGRSAEDIANAAASMGGDVEVGVSRLQTSVGLSVLSDRTADAVRLVADVARRPAFPAAELPRLRQNLARRLAVALSAPGPTATKLLAAAYYGPDHPYGRIVPTEAQLSAYTVEDVRAFHAKNFGARRARLYVAGRFDAAAVKAAVNAAFGDWAAGPERLSLPPKPVQGPKVILANRPGAPQSTLRLAFRAPVAGTVDDIPMRVTNALLGGSFSSRITRNIRESKGYTYSPGSGLTFSPGDALWTFNADVTSSVTGPALKEVFHEIRELQTKAPGVEEAGGISSFLAGTFILQNGSPAALVNSLATRDALGLPGDWLDTYVPAVLGVSPAKIQATAAAQLPLDRLVLVVVGDLATVRPQLEALPELKGMTLEVVTP